MSPRFLFSCPSVVSLLLELGCSRPATVAEGPDASGGPSPPGADPASAPERAPTRKFLNEPLLEEIFTADPSAHVFEDRIYVYSSHDIDAGVVPDDQGNHFAMRDYHVLSMDRVGATVRDHGVALALEQVPWAKRQMWAPDAAFTGGKYYFYFPAKDEEDVFRIGVAVGDRPEGPFAPDPTPIPGSFSIDPAVFQDEDGVFFMYFGGIWGGQLQRWKSGEYRATDDAEPPGDQPALCPKIARLTGDMRGFAEAPRDVVIVDEDGRPLLSGDSSRRFFEAAWVHVHEGTYYLSYSTGDTHFIAYATGASPYGPFSYRGRVLEPVLGWTNHHSIVRHGGRWYLFYHDAELSGGQTHLRNVKVTELVHEPDGAIRTVDAWQD